MESFWIAWRLLLLTGVFAFTQLLGILLYFRLSRAPRFIAVIVGILAPAVFFVFLAPLFLFAGMREAYGDGPTCGMPAFGGILILYAGTIIQLVLSLITQVVLLARRRQVSKASLNLSPLA